MRYRNPPAGYDAQTEAIRRLEDELYSARRTIVNLMPDPIASTLSSYHDCQTRNDYWKWQQSVIDAIIETAVADPTIGYYQQRGWCPLCRGGSSGPYDRGYALPEGMRRHLDGHGNTASCPVTRAAFDLARDYLEDRFQKEEADGQAKLQQRRQTEPMLLTDPNQPPHLMDDQTFSCNKLREAEGLKSAEDRLSQVGFVKEVEGNITAWRLRRDEWTVLADPRPSTQIQFVVFREPDPETKPCRSRGRTPRRIETSSFQMLDSWKHDIPGKFNQRLDQAIQNLRNGGRTHR